MRRLLTTPGPARLSTSPSTVPGVRALGVRTLGITGALTVLAAALAVGLGTAAGFGRPAGWALPALAVAVAASELAVVHLPLGAQRWTLSCTDALCTLVFALAPGGWMVLSVPAGVAVAQLIRRRRMDRLVFNVAQFAAAAAAGAFAAGVAAGAGLPRLSVAAVAMTAFWLVQTPLVAGVVAVGDDRPLPLLLAGSAPVAFVHTAASAAVGLLAAWLTVHAPVGLLGLLVPVVLLLSSFDQSGHRAGEARLFAELARGQEEAGGGSVDVSAQVLLTAAARLFGGAEVQMLVFGGDGLVRYAGDALGVPVHERVGVQAMDAPWIPEVLAGGVVSGIDAAHPYCGMRVGPAERPLALLLARRGPGTGPFTRREIRLARVLVGQAESWLAVADLAAARDAALGRAAAAGHTARALGDLGADTAPALTILRESAGRLSRLAAQGDGQDAVAGIVEELHTVERAVASLLGAIALAADPELAGPPGSEPGPSPVRPAREADPQGAWTSTGGPPGPGLR